MAKFTYTYTGGDVRYVPDIGQTVSPGDKVECDVELNSPLFVAVAKGKRVEEADN